MPLRDLRRHLEPYHSIVNVPHNGSHVVDFFHLSFSEYLQDKARAPPDFWVDQGATDELLFRRCIDIMNQNLHYDMCHLNLPGFLRSEVSQEHVDRMITPPGQYACAYWVQHLVLHSHMLPDKDPTLWDDGVLHNFVKANLLYWLEVVSLTRRIVTFIYDLGHLRGLAVKQADKSFHLCEMLFDAHHFVMRNRYIIERAPLQIYSSALIFSPVQSTVRSQFRHLEPLWITTKPLVDQDRGPDICTLEGHTDNVICLAANPTGLTMASGGEDGTVKLWDVVTGAEVASFSSLVSNSGIKTNRALGNAIHTLRFSPNGRVLGFFSQDQSIVGVIDLATTESIFSFDMSSIQVPDVISKRRPAKFLWPRFSKKPLCELVFSAESDQLILFWRWGALNQCWTQHFDIRGNSPLTGPQQLGIGHLYEPLAFSPSGSMLVARVVVDRHGIPPPARDPGSCNTSPSSVSGGPRQLALYDKESEETKHIISTSDYIKIAAISHNCHEVILVSQKNDIMIWEVSTGQCRTWAKLQHVVLWVAVSARMNVVGVLSMSSHTKGVCIMLSPGTQSVGLNIPVVRWESSVPSRWADFESNPIFSHPEGYLAISHLNSIKLRYVFLRLKGEATPFTNHVGNTPGDSASKAESVGNVEILPDGDVGGSCPGDDLPDSEFEHTWDSFTQRLLGSGIWLPELEKSKNGWREIGSVAVDSTWFSPDGNILALRTGPWERKGSGDQYSLQFWDHRIPARRAIVDACGYQHAVFSHDASRVATAASCEPYLVVMDTESWVPSTKIELIGEVKQLIGFSSCGTFLAWLCAEPVESKELTKDIGGNGERGAAPRSRSHEVTEEARKVFVNNLRTGNTCIVDGTVWYKCGRDFTSLLQFSPDGTLIAIETIQGITLADTSTGHKQCSIPNNSDAHSLFFNSDWSLLGLGSDWGRITIVDVASGETKFACGPENKPPSWRPEDLELPRSRDSLIAFSPSSNLVVRATAKQEVDWLAELQVWNINTGEEVSHFNVVGYPSHPRFSSDSARIVTRSGVYPINCNNILPPSSSLLEEGLPEDARESLSYDDQWMVQGFGRLLWVPPQYRQFDTRNEPIVVDGSRIRFGSVVEGWGHLPPTVLEFDLENTPLARPR